jgi:hypothetical protein
MNTSRLDYKKQPSLILSDKPKILIANDNWQVLEVQAKQFKQYFEVHTADNGYVAL